MGWGGRDNIEKNNKDEHIRYGMCYAKKGGNEIERDWVTISDWVVRESTT